MRVAHTVEQIRAAEADLMARLPEGTLMQRAAAGLATAIADFLGATYGAHVVLLIGSGDNGGDALYAGERLARRGAQVGAVLLSDKAHAAGLAALRQAGGRVIAPDEVSRADVVVDGIVGIGGHPGLRPEAAAVLDLVEQLDIPVVAVDVPSGVEVDTGATPERHVHAAFTVTFGTHKICHLIDPAASSCGPVHLVDIGLDLPEPAAEALQPENVAWLYPLPNGASDKYSRGVTGLMVGSEQYPGAAVLASGGALGGSLGMVRYVGPDAVAEAVRSAHPEVVAGVGRVQSWVIGSGLGEHADADRIAEICAAPEPVVIDADGLRFLPSRFTSPVLLTPHAGELSRLIDVPRDEIEANRLRYARAAADRYNATVLLKGSTTVVAAPDGRVRVNTNATPWLASAGAGDVLAGLCGALLAGGLSPFDAGSVGAFLHAAAARLASGGGPLTASAVAAKLPEATRQLLTR
jgi:ADP-dependent NAD(P)H-hydrate dehydratase / NAD(P)H-hydrate epimerase